MCHIAAAIRPTGSAPHASRRGLGPDSADVAGRSAWCEILQGCPLLRRLPSGVMTFLFTDVEGSTRRLETDADGMRAALAAHDVVLRSAIDAATIAGFAFSPLTTA
jgi:hypothetical protein